MKTLIFLLTIIAFSKASPNTQETTDKILDIFEQRNNVKELFKVWHMIYEKDYNYNTQEGIQKYVTFKQNLKVIQEHNSKDTFYKQGLNHLSDMTYEEIVNYYNLKPISHKEMKGFLQNMISLDDYNEEDDDESIKIQSKSGIVGRAKKDVRAYMRPVRDQLGCD